MEVDAREVSRVKCVRLSAERQICLRGLLYCVTVLENRATLGLQLEWNFRNLTLERHGDQSPKSQQFESYIFATSEYFPESQHPQRRRSVFTVLNGVRSLSGHPLRGHQARREPRYFYFATICQQRVFSIQSTEGCTWLLACALASRSQIDRSTPRVSLS